MKFTIALFFLLVSVRAEAQLELPFPSTISCSWEMIYQHFGDPWSGPSLHYYETVYTDEFEQDTIINGYSYRRLRTDANGSFPMGHYRVDSLKVYYRDHTTSGNSLFYSLYSQANFGDTGEVLLYDFGLQIGDTFKIESNCDIQLMSIDSMLLNGNYYRKFNFEGIACISQPYYWVEGIGSSAGPLPYFSYFEATMCMNRFVLNSTLEEFYFSPNFACDALEVTDLEADGFTVSPNPVGSELSFHRLSEKDATVNIYDLKGNEVLNYEVVGVENTLNVSSLNSGVYYIVVQDDSMTYRGRIVKL